jgi:D-glycero-D-manno-heptose 1,7-bisphosphate phosphatase
MGKLNLKSCQQSTREKLKIAIFFDLDGTIINTKSGEIFSKDKDDWKLIPGVRNIMHQAQLQETEIVIVSNQGGIESKYISKAHFEEKIHKIVKTLDLDKPVHAYYCPTNDPNDVYRKPDAGMFYQAALDHNLYLLRSVMVGDGSGNFQIPESAIMSRSTEESLDYITTKARPNKIEVLSVKDKIYTVKGWSDTDLRVCEAAGLYSYIDIDQLLSQDETNSK